MKKYCYFFAFIASIYCCSANAFFFFFPLGSTSDPNEKCVSEKVKEGQNITFEGKYFLVKSIYGTSYKCTNKDLPILVKVEATNNEVVQASTKFKILLPDGWEPKPITDAMKSGGTVLYSSNRTIDSGVALSTTPKKGITDIKTYVNLKRITNNQLQDVSVTEISEITINNLKAYQYEKSGVIKNIKLTYLSTWFEFEDELVLLNFWTNTGSYDTLKNKFSEILSTANGFWHSPKPLDIFHSAV